MSGPLDRRLVALERLQCARGLVIRTYATEAESKADAEPAPWGAALLKIVSGVARAPDGIAP